jgi:hypothetical protein
MADAAAVDKAPTHGDLPQRASILARHWAKLAAVSLFALWFGMTCGVSLSMALGSRLDVGTVLAGTFIQFGLMLGANSGLAVAMWHARVRFDLARAATDAGAAWRRLFPFAATACAAVCALTLLATDAVARNIPCEPRYAHACDDTRALRVAASALQAAANLGNLMDGVVSCE